MEENRWTERASRLLFVGGVTVGVVLVLRWLSPLVWVLILGGAVAAVVDPLARKTAKGTRLPRKLCAGIYVILLLILLGTAVGWIVTRLWRELSSLGQWMNENPGWLEERGQQLIQWLQGVTDRIPFLDGERVGVETWLQEAIGAWGAKLGSGAGNLLRRTPEAIMTLVVGILCCFYLSLDGRELFLAIRHRLPQALQSRVIRLSDGLRRGLGRYLRAYVLLMALTFSELWVGLTVLGQPYAFLLSVLIALVDILPVLGAGTVLLPWAAFAFLFHESPLGVGLLILYGVITIVRQVAEPYFVGESLGVHPLLILLCAFGCFLIFGFGGMLLGPLVAVLLRELARPDPSAMSRE